jgi:hypothetical protein
MNRLVSKDVSDNIIAGAVMALSSMKNMSLKFVTYKDATNVTVGFAGCLIPVKMGDYWGLIDTATDVNTTTDLDTGSLAPSTTYYVYSVTNGSTISFKTSVTPTAPTGYTTADSEQLGEFTTNISSEVDSTSVRSIKFKIDGIYIKGGTNTFNITNGTASLDVAAGATVNIDANLTVETASAINQDLTTDATAATFAGARFNSPTNTTFPVNIGSTGGNNILFTGRDNGGVDEATFEIRKHDGSTYHGYIQGYNGALRIAGGSTLAIEISSSNVTVSSLAGSGSRAVNADANGVLSATSDERLKENIIPISDSLDVLGLLEDQTIRGIYYNWKDRSQGEGREIGFTAQMFETSVPEVTGHIQEIKPILDVEGNPILDVEGNPTTERIDKMMYLDYQKLTAVLWEQNKAQQVLIKNLTTRVEALEAVN